MQVEGQLNGRVALVTGSGQGIGRAIAERLAQEGAVAIFSDLVPARAEQAAAEARARGLGAGALALDVADPASITAGFDALLAEHGRLDILVNNAGVGISAPFLDFTLDDFQRCLRVNLTGAFLCAQRAARQMLSQDPRGHRGKIVNVTSISGGRGGMGRAGYGASKAGLDLLTRVMATELAGRGLNVNAVAPGPVDTELARAVHARGGQRDAYLFLTPQHRYGEAAEMARAVLFLASDASDYINGHTLPVDGGFSAAGLMYPLPGARA